MKKLSVILIAVFMYCSGTTSAQCIINNANNVNGITPSTLDDTIVQGIVYSQTLQIHLPTTYSEFTVDSVHITSITGAPSGINYIINPASGTINGGANGVVCFAGTTYADTGSYPVIFNGLIYFSFLGEHSSAPLSSTTFFNYGFEVVAQPSSGSAPVAGFLNDSVGCLNVPVTFADQSIDSPTVWQWTFAGGNPPSSTDSAVSVTYTDTGYYAVKLVVSNTFGADSITKSIHITGNPSGMVVVNPVTGSPDSANGSVIISATGGTTPYAYTWSASGNIGDTLSGADTGTYYITITDENGCIALDTAIVTLAPPVAGFSADSVSCINALITFTDTSANSPTSWQWFFPDGTGADTTSSVAYASYPDTGVYNVMLVAGNSGGFDTIIKTIYVAGNPAATAAVYPVTNSPDSANGSVIITATGGTPPYAYTWYANNNSTDTLSNIDTGAYYVTITDNNGCMAVDTALVTFLQPVADFSGDTLACVNTPVTFTDQSTENPIGWNWTFTGGNPPTAGASSVSVIYADTGYYPVKLVLTYSFGYDSITKMIHVVGTPGVTDTTVQLACGDSIWFGGTVYKYSVTQTDTFTGIYGCDSVVTLHLSVSQNINLYDTIACGDSLNFYGTWLDTAGIYTAYRNGNSECDSQLVLTLTVNPGPQVAFTWDSLVAASDVVALNSLDTAIWWDLCNPDVFVLTGGTPEGGVYTGAAVSGDTMYANELYSQHIFQLVTDTITYTYQCSSVSRILLLSFCEGIKQINTPATLQLYPNPATDYLTISYSGFTGNTKIEIADVTGRIVISEEVADGVSKTDIDTRQLNNGLYFITVESGAVQRASSKFIVIR